MREAKPESHQLYRNLKAFLKSRGQQGQRGRHDKIPLRSGQGSSKDPRARARKHGDQRPGASQATTAHPHCQGPCACIYLLATAHPHPTSQYTHRSHLHRATTTTKKKHGPQHTRWQLKSNEAPHRLCSNSQATDTSVHGILHMFVFLLLVSLFGMPPGQRPGCCPVLLRSRRLQSALQRKRVY